MKVEINVCFEGKEGVIQAVETLLRHGISEEDIALILPQPRSNHKPHDHASSYAQPEVVAAPMHNTSAVVVGSEEGLGVGIGLGLLTAMCIPGIGLIVASATIIAALVAAGALIGGIAGGIYGYLVELDIPHDVAVTMANHISSGGATLRVIVADAGQEEVVLKMVAEAGGKLITEIIQRSESA